MTTNGFSTAIHELLPKIRERRGEIEEARRLPRDLVADLTATGVFRIGVPSAFGGLGDEGELLDGMRAIEMLSSADGSTGWCSMLAIGGGTVAGYMREDGAR